MKLKFLKYVKYIGIVSLTCIWALSTISCIASHNESYTLDGTIENDTPLGTFTEDDRRILQADPRQIQRENKEKLEEKKREHEETQRELEEINEALIAQQAEAEDVRNTLEALDDTALENQMQTLIEDIENTNASLQLDSTTEEEKQALNARLPELLNKLSMINEILAERRNADIAPDHHDQVDGETVVEVISDITEDTLETENILETEEGLEEEDLRERQAELEEKIETQKEEISQIEAVIHHIEHPSLDDYGHIRVKLFPNKITNRYDLDHYPSVEGEDRKYAKLHNKNGFAVQKINPVSNQVLENLGQAHIVEMFFDCPNRTTSCSTNRIVLDENQNKTFYLQSDAVSVVPLQDITSSTSSNYFDLGATNVQWNNYSGFFRGSFRIQFAQHYWSIINSIDLDVYLLSVVPSELNSNTEEAVKAQILVARTYAVNRSRLARRRGRVWDVLPTTSSQLYLGMKSERADYYNLVMESRKQVLFTGAKVTLTEYYSCGSPRTIDPGSLPNVDPLTEQKVRNIPSHRCSNGRRKARPNGDVVAFGHGRGLPQLAAVQLAQHGWPSTETRRPTPEATVPTRLDQPWTANDIVKYFYNQTRVGSIEEINI